MIEVNTISLDLAKNVFQVHGISDGGTVVIRRRPRRAEVMTFFSRLLPCLVGMEAIALLVSKTADTGEKLAVVSCVQS